MAKGAWMGSPLCRALMEEQGMEKAHDLAEYFITRVADCLQQHHLSFNGWQEVALGHQKDTHTYLSQRAAGINSWKTVPRLFQYNFSTSERGSIVLGYYR